jgi:hypothetical protein
MESKRIIIDDKINKLAEKKWQWIVDNWDYNETIDENDTNLLKSIPELRAIGARHFYCSYCVKYHYMDEDNVHLHCDEGCPVIKNGKSCFDVGSHIKIWGDYVCFRIGTERSAKIHARKLLNHIKNIKED